MSTYNDSLKYTMKANERELELSGIDIQMILKWYYSSVDEFKAQKEMYEKNQKLTFNNVFKYMQPESNIKIFCHLFLRDVDSIIKWSNSVFESDWTNEDEKLYAYFILVQKDEHKKRADYSKKI